MDERGKSKIGVYVRMAGFYRNPYEVRRQLETVKPYDRTIALSEVNRVRRNEGLPPLPLNEQLD